MADSSQTRWGGDFESLQRENMRLAKQVDHLATLREIGLAISGTLDLPEILATIAHVVQSAVDVKRLTIYEVYKEQDALRPIIAKYGIDLITRERLEEELVPRRGTALGEALESRAVVRVGAPEVREVLVPLAAKGEMLGVMALRDRRDGEPFDDEDTGLLQELGSQIAIGIHNAKLYAMAVTDGLTGLFVRRYFDLRMEEEVATSKRYGRPFSIMMYDIDHFKKFNDTHGHQTGDLVLKEFAQLLQRNTRNSDICCRYGGEEMAVILPETGLDEAAVLANKLCAYVRRNVFHGTGGQELSVTTSVGVAACSEEYDSPAAMVRAADAALYEAKELGRNRVELAV